MVFRKNALNWKKNQRIIHLNLRKFKWKCLIIGNKCPNLKWSWNHFGGPTIISKEIWQVRNFTYDITLGMTPRVDKIKINSIIISAHTLIHFKWTIYT